MSASSPLWYTLPADGSLNPGLWGEALVAQWLLDTGWEILARRWRCRWGEIDVIAWQSGYTTQSSSFVKGDIAPDSVRSEGGLLTFVEVKTRSPRSWDAGGLLAISPGKQAKLIQTAELFLVERPELAEFPCRFDVALVQYQRQRRSPLSGVNLPSDRAGQPSPPLDPIRLGQPQPLGDYCFTLHDYICGAFDA
ncbi:MAG TPA: YraN family protein [Vampirovibrionales bacterium]